MSTGMIFPIFFQVALATVRLNVKFNSLPGVKLIHFMEASFIRTEYDLHT